MNTTKKQLVFLITFCMALSSYATDYYVDATNGSDSNNGISDTTPWQSLSKVNGFIFLPGDNIYFKAGETWIGQLKPQSSGNSANPITFGKYGTTDYDTRPLIDGNGLWAAIYVYNIEYITVQDFEVINNKDPNQYDRKGILVENQDQGKLSGIKLLNNYVHDVKGEMSSSEGSQTGKAYTGSQGIMIATTKGTNPVYSYYDDILVEGNQIINCDRTGYSHDFAWSCVDGVVGTNCNPNEPGLSTNTIIRNNYVEKSGGDGILPRSMKDGVVEYNLLFDNNVRGSVMGLANIATWSTRCVGSIWQFNEAYATRGTFDGESFDLDGGSKDVIFQYNYSHDNRGGFMLIIEFGDTKTSYNTVRYNISQNDKARLLHLTTDSGNNKIYNNTFYVPQSNTQLSKIIIKNGGSGYEIFNNIFYLERDAVWDAPNGYVARNNIIYYPNGGQHSSSPVGTNGNVNVNPLLIGPGTGTTGSFTNGIVTLGNVDGYKLASGSPAIGMGELVADNGGRDYFGNTVSSLAAPSIGAYEGGGTITTAPTAPSNVTAENQSNTVLLNWDDNANNEYNFVVERSTTSGSGFSTVATLLPNTLTYTDTNVVGSTTYYYRVKTSNAIGDSAYTSEVNITTIEFTATTLTPIEDSYVRRGANSSNNYGGVDYLRVKNSNSDSYDRDAVLKFDLSSVSGDVSSAKLRLYNSSGENETIAVYLANTDTWSETTVTANDIDASGSAIATITVGSTAQYYEWDITSLINTEVNGDGSVSLILKGVNADEKTVDFESKENTNIPQLDIVASPPNNTSTLGAIDDSYVRRGTNSGNNYSTANFLRVKNSNSDSYDRDAVLKFDLSSLSGSVDNATLRLYMSNFDQVQSSSSVIEVYHATTDTWSEGTVTANDINATGTAIASVTVDGTLQYYEWDVSSLVANEMVGDGTVSFILKSLNPEENTVDFHSKESINIPELIVTTIPPPNNTSTLGAIDDSYVRRGTNSGNNYSTANFLRVKNSNSDSYDRDAVLKFDLSSLSGSVDNATLRLYMSNFDQVQSSSSVIEVYHATTDTWSEGTVTANDINATGTAIASVTVDGTLQYYEWDVSSLVANEMVGDGTVSFILKSLNPEENTVDFHSKESINIPELVVTTSGLTLKLSDVKSKSLSIKGEYVKEDLSVVLFPNPTTERLTLRGELLKGTTVDIIGLSGVMIKQLELSEISNSQDIDVSDLRIGMYVLRVTNPNDPPVILKFIKK